MQLVYRNPVRPGEFADPFVLKWRGSTMRMVRVVYSTPPRLTGFRLQDTKVLGRQKADEPALVAILGG